jgi:hypothetical protein
MFIYIYIYIYIHKWGFLKMWDPQVIMGFNTKPINLCPNNQYDQFLRGCDGVFFFWCNHTLQVDALLPEGKGDEATISAEALEEVLKSVQGARSSLPTGFPPENLRSISLKGHPQTAHVNLPRS